MTKKELQLVLDAYYHSNEVLRVILGDVAPCESKEDKTIVDAFYAANKACLRIYDMLNEGGEN